MTEPKQTGFKKGFLFGINTEERNKTYILSVEATSLADATDKMTHAITAIKNNELVIFNGYGLAGGDFRFYMQNESLQQEPAGNANELTIDTKPGISHDIRLQVIELIDQQLRGVIDAITARASWYRLMEENGNEALVDYLTWALHGALNRSLRKQVSYGTDIRGIPLSDPEHEQRAENYAEICRVIAGQINDHRDLNRANRFWHNCLNRTDCDRSMLIDALMHVLSYTCDDMNQS